MSGPLARLASVLGVALVGAACAISPAQAQAPVPYPQKVVTLVTHSTPGSGSDIFLRELAKYLHKYINATFIVENDDGGSGAKAVSRVAAAKPTNTYRDLDPVVNFFTDAGFAYTRTGSPYKTLKDVIDHARSSRGRWGVSNPASLERETAEQLKLAAKVNPAIVSHQGGSDMMINVLNGTLDMGLGEIEEIRSQLEGRKLRLVATFNDTRMENYPDVPTAKELGYNVVMVKFRGLAAPKGLPLAIMKIWDDAARKILADPEYKKSYEDENLVPRYLAHDAYGPFIAQFAADTSNFLKSTGVIR
jgi:tripartite-type tricarboxylate transporter receptor subunit TctC